VTADPRPSGYRFSCPACPATLWVSDDFRTDPHLSEIVMEEWRTRHPGHPDPILDEDPPEQGDR